MKKVNGYKIVQYIYESEEERQKHVAEMEAAGWLVGINVMRRKPGVSILNATDDDYEWFGDFQKYDEVEV